MLFTLIGVGGVVMYQFRKRNKYGAGRTDSLEEIDECAVDWPTRCIVRYIVVKSCEDIIVHRGLNWHSWWRV